MMHWKQVRTETDLSQARPARGRTSSRLSNKLVTVQSIVAFQVVCTLLFLVKTMSDFLGVSLYFVPWSVLEIVEMLAVTGMLFGVISGFLLFREGHKRMEETEKRMKAAAGEFHDHLLSQFDQWELTPTEKDIALFVIKGFSNLEIATMRGTTESTVKSQVSAIFRKSGVASRQQLATWAVEDLINALTPSQPTNPDAMMG